MKDPLLQILILISTGLGPLCIIEIADWFLTLIPYMSAGNTYHTRAASEC